MFHIVAYKLLVDSGTLGGRKCGFRRSNVDSSSDRLVVDGSIFERHIEHLRIGRRLRNGKECKGQKMIPLQEDQVDEWHRERNMEQLSDVEIRSWMLKTVK